MTRGACLCTVLSTRVMVVTETEPVEPGGTGERSLDTLTSFSSAPPDSESLSGQPGEHRRLEHG